MPRSCDNWAACAAQLNFASLNSFICFSEPAALREWIIQNGPDFGYKLVAVSHGPGWVMCFFQSGSLGIRYLCFWWPVCEFSQRHFSAANCTKACNGWRLRLQTCPTLALNLKVRACAPTRLNMDNLMDGLFVGDWGNVMGGTSWLCAQENRLKLLAWVTGCRVRLVWWCRSVRLCVTRHSVIWFLLVCQIFFIDLKLMRHHCVKRA